MFYEPRLAVCLSLGIMWLCGSVKYMELAENAPANAALSEFSPSTLNEDGQAHASAAARPAAAVARPASAAARCGPSQLSGPRQVEIAGMPVSQETQLTPETHRTPLVGPSQVAIEVEGMPVSSDTHTNPNV